MSVQESHFVEIEAVNVSVISKGAIWKTQEIIKKKKVRCLTECFSHHTACLFWVVQTKYSQENQLIYFHFLECDNIIAVLLQLNLLENSWGTSLVKYVWGSLFLNQYRGKCPRSFFRTFTISWMSLIALRRFSRAGWTRQPALCWTLTVL